MPKRKLLAFSTGRRNIIRGLGDHSDEQEFADVGPLQAQLDPSIVSARRAELSSASPTCVRS